MEKINGMRRDGLRNIFIVIFSLAGVMPLIAQSVSDTVSGEVSYKTSQSIYVRFNTTEGISIGDTLYVMEDEKLSPVLAVKYLSSTSCVGTSLTDKVIDKGTRIFAKRKIIQETQPSIVEHQDAAPETPTPVVLPEEHGEDETYPKQAKIDKLTGRISAAAYFFFGDKPEDLIQRMRYTFSMNAKQIGNTKLSAETYISFRHTINEWQEVREHFGKAFKIYNLALKYDVSEQTSVWVGRKINHNISNVGAIDGIQAEQKFKKILLGVFAGSRPDHTDYGFNSDLLQFGAYAGHLFELPNGNIQNTIAIAEQRNTGMTDRRFAYFQHTNSAIKRIYVFTSFEFDLYTMENDKPRNTFNVSSLYASIRYRPVDKLSVFGSYDARKNIIYYETYKNFIDQLLEDETRQGFRLSFNYRPFKKVSVGSSAGYRFQKENPNDSKNLHSYVTISRIPGVHVSATFSSTLIESAYLNGRVFGVRLSRDIINGKLFGELTYRLVEYKYKSAEAFPLKQSIAGANLSWRINKKLSFSVDYEGEIYNKDVSSRVYANIIQRF
jgi:hypothetical protein